jgi:hypothetical protein
LCRFFAFQPSFRGRNHSDDRMAAMRPSAATSQYHRHISRTVTRTSMLFDNSRMSPPNHLHLPRRPSRIRNRDDGHHPPSPIRSRRPPCPRRGSTIRSVGGLRVSALAFTKSMKKSQ